jgi:hypothetical protein
MDVFRAIEVLFLDPERAADAAIVLHPVPERPVIGLEGVAAPCAPAGKFTFGADVQVGAVEECRLGKLVHGKRPSREEQSP